VDKKLIKELRQLLGDDGVVWRPEELLLYEYDAMPGGKAARIAPDAVALPRNVEQVVRVVRLARDHHIPLVGRGAGTGLAGGALTPRGGILVVFSRMKRILEIDLANLRAVVEPGVVNLDLSAATAPSGCYFAPDPSSQKACTIGGNVATNAGGPHTLAYGVTSNHILGLEVVLPTGELVPVGGKAFDTPGYDLTGLLVGSEGTLAVVTKVIVKLSRLPEAVKTLLAIFDSIDDATETVADLTARGITPAACEMLDQFTLGAVEAFIHAGFPLDAAACLLIELEGLREAVDAQAGEVEEVCRAHRARDVRRARDAAEREKLWAGRKNAFGAVGRLAPNYYALDGVIPRTRLPETLRRVIEIGQRHGFRVGNVFHAGDGNLHPLLLFDARDREQFARVVQAAEDIIRLCVEMGGSITGEHGVGLEKRDLMPLLFTDADFDAMLKVRSVFNPSGLLNPDKVIPLGKSCGELQVRPLPQTTGA
jgi:glycolate oxidase